MIQICKEVEWSELASRWGDKEVSRWTKTGTKDGRIHTVDRLVGRRVDISDGPSKYVLGS